MNDDLSSMMKLVRLCSFVLWFSLESAPVDILDVLRRARDRFPVTASCLFLSGLLMAAVMIHQQRNGLTFAAALQDWGAVNEFDVWSGQWWRVFASAFLHGGLLHLILNAMAIWYMGGLLEPRLGSVKFGLFVLGSMAVSGLAQSFTGSWVGLSGMAFALFGMLIVLRQVDEQVALDFSTGMVHQGLIWLVGCVILTRLEILAIGNACHIAGLAYGWLCGQAVYGRHRSRGLRTLFLAAHLLLLPGFYFLLHPFWNANYHWRLGDLSDDDEQKLIDRKSTV